LSQLIIASNKTLWSIIDLTDPVTGQEVNNKSNYDNRPLASLVTPVTELQLDHNDPSLGTTRYRDDATPQSVRSKASSGRRVHQVDIPVVSTVSLESTGTHDHGLNWAEIMSYDPNNTKDYPNKHR